MKKHLLLGLIAFTAWTSPAFAQLGVGLRGGFGASSTSEEMKNGMNRTIGTGPTFGLSVLYDLDLHFSGCLEFNYLSWSEKLSYSESFDKVSGIPVSTEIKVNYLQVPLLGKVTFGEKKFKTLLTFGPYMGIATSGSWTNPPVMTASGIVIYPQGNSLNARFGEGDFRKVDLGGIVGFGGQYKVGESGNIFFEGRIQLGFLNLYNDLEKKLSEAYSISQYQKPGGSWRAANITVGYFHTFKLPKKKTSAAKKAGKQKKR
jgi:hypothetical protein